MLHLRLPKPKVKGVKKTLAEKVTKTKLVKSDKVVEFFEPEMEEILEETPSDEEWFKLIPKKPKPVADGKIKPTSKRVVTNHKVADGIIKPTSKRVVANHKVADGKIKPTSKVKNPYV